MLNFSLKNGSGTLLGLYSKVSTQAIISSLRKVWFFAFHHLIVIHDTFHLGHSFLRLLLHGDLPFALVVLEYEPFVQEFP
jgi:hypothetical protein